MRIFYKGWHSGDFDLNTSLLHRALFLLFCAIALLPPLTRGQPAQENKPVGWSVFVGLGLARIEREALTQETIQSYAEEPEFESLLVYWPTFSLLYTDGKKGDWSIGNQNEIVGLQWRQPTPIGVFEISYGLDYFYLLIEEYQSREFKNPYLLHSERETTGVNKTRTSFSYTAGREVVAILKYGVDEIQYEDDETENSGLGVGYLF